MDCAGPFLGKYFFVLADASSKWPGVRIVPDITTETTIEVEVHFLNLQHPIF